MAKQNEDHNVTRPRMLYGDVSPTMGTVGRRRPHQQESTEGSVDTAPKLSRARFFRSYSRNSRRPSHPILLTGTTTQLDLVSENVVSSSGRFESDAGGNVDGSFTDRHLRGSVVERKFDDNIVDRTFDESVVDSKFDESAVDKRFNESVVDGKFDESVGRKVDESFAGRKFDDSRVDRRFDESFADRKLYNSVIDRKHSDSVVDRQLDNSVVNRKPTDSAAGRKSAESFVSRKFDERAVDRKLYSSAIDRKLSDSVVDRQFDNSVMNRNPADSGMGRKSTQSFVDRKFVESVVDRKFSDSIIIGRKSSRYSTKPNPIDHRRTPRTIKAENRNKTSKSRKSRPDDCRFSRLDDLSRSTSYYLGDIVDENLLISAAKLDSTLIRLFSHARENQGETRDEQDPGTALMPFLNYSQSDLISMDAVLWRVFPMDAAQRETLDQELPYIEENMTSDNVMRHLYDKAILTHMDYNQLTRTEGQGDKAVTRLMVKTLQRRGDKAYPAFLEALQAYSYTRIFARLAETERSLRDAMAADRSETGNRSKIDYASIHRYKSIKTPQLRTLSVLEATTENLTPPTFISSANHVSTFGNDTGLSSHMPSLVEQSPVGGTYHVKQETALDVNPASSDLHIVNSKQLEKQLLELMAEFEALQKEVIAMKSAQSPQGSTDTPSNCDEVESEQPVNHFDIHEVSSVDRASIASNHPECRMDLTPEPSSRKVAQKSISCLIL